MPAFRSTTAAPSAVPVPVIVMLPPAEVIAAVGAVWEARLELVTITPELPEPPVPVAVPMTLTLPLPPAAIRAKLLTLTP